MAADGTPRPTGLRQRHRSRWIALAAGAALAAATTPGVVRLDAQDAAPPPPAPSAQPPEAPAGPPPEQLAEAQRRHRALGVRIAGLQQEAHALGRQSTSLMQELRRLAVEQDLQRAQAEQARVSLGVIEHELNDIERRLVTLQARQAEEAPAVAARLQRLQRMGRVGYARIVWGASSARTLGRAARLMTRMAREDADRLQRYRDGAAQIAATEARLQERRAQAVELRSSSARQLRLAEVAADERRQLLASLDAQRDRQLQFLSELQRAQEALDGTVAAYRPPAGAPALPVGPLPSLRRSLPWPVAGSVQQRFGREREARFGTLVARNGLSIASPAGSTVRAIHAGTVAYADLFEGFGQLVIVDHGQQAFSLYGYLSGTRVERGDQLGAGDPVGDVGEAPTGGAALYFELRIDGRPVDPLQWLERR